MRFPEAVNDWDCMATGLFVCRPERNNGVNYIKHLKKIPNEFIEELGDHAKTAVIDL